MSEREFYDYIIENYNLDGAASRLVQNIIWYVKAHGFENKWESYAHLKFLLDGAFGIEEHEIKRYRSGD